MKLLVLVCLLLSLLLSTATRRENRRHRICKRNVRANAGSLERVVRNCDQFTWSFHLEPQTRLNLVVSGLQSSRPLQVKRKTSTQTFIAEQIITEDGNASIESEANSSRINLIVPSDQFNSIRIRYKILSRPYPPPHSGQCHSPSIATRWQCSDEGCWLECNSPFYIPAVQNVTSVSCRSSDWREQALSLCITRSSLAELCFDRSGWAVECGYSVDAILEYFQNEENEAENDRPNLADAPATRPPDNGLPRTAGIRRQGPRRRRAKFRDYVCRRNKETGKYRWKCAEVQPPFIRRCIYWRYVTKLCKGSGVFT